MKNRIGIFLIAAVTLAAALPLMAETETVDGYTWTYFINGDTVEICADGYGYAAVTPTPTGTITVPSLLGGKLVTSIGSDAFLGCSGLTSVTIPNSVTNIGYEAFRNCIGLTDVTIPDSVTSIGDCAFEFCSTLTNVTIGSGVTNIGDAAFSGCSGLTSVTIPGGVTSIGDRAFSGCSGLTSVTIPESVTIIWSYTFYGCSGLTSVTIPDGVTSIGSYAFYYCSGLTSVTIPDSVTSIGEDAFSNCNALIYDMVTIPGVRLVDGWAIDHADMLSGQQDLTGVRGIAYGAFRYCDALTGVMIPNSVKGIGDYAFQDCSGLTSVTIGNGVMSIGVEAFSGCIGLVDLTIGNGVTSIGYKAFSGCSGLASVAIGNGVTSIGSYAFNTCSGLTSVTIPDSVTSIGYKAFSGCSGLASVAIGNGVTNISSHAFCYCSGLTSVTIPDNVMSIGYAAFFGCSGLEEITLPFVGARRGSTVSADSVFGYIFGTSSYSGGTETYQHYSFDSSSYYYIPSKLRKVVITDETELGSYAFRNCSGLTSLTIPESVTYIGTLAFSGCTGLADANGFVVIRGVLQDYYGSATSVTIPDSVTSIGPYAFYYCTGLTSVTIPDSVTSIGYAAFFGCSGLEEITLPFVGARRGNMVSADSVFGYIFGTSPYSGGTETYQYYSVNSSSYYYIPSKLRKVIITGETILGPYAFRNCSGLASVTIPASVTSIGYEAFYGCGGLKSVYISIEYTNSTSMFPSNVTFIRYKPNPSVSFDAAGGDVSPVSSSFQYGSAYGELPIPSRNGYSFNGWIYDGQSISNETIVSALDDHTLVAQWDVNQYMVTFEGNGGALGERALPSVTNTQNYGTEIVAPTATRAGYTFAGWQPALLETVPAGNVTYTAQWDANQYTVTFEGNGGTGGKSVTQNYGTAIVAPTVTREGYTFAGWQPAPLETVPANDVMYTAQWTVNQYTQTFDANGGTGGKSVTQDYGASLTAPTVMREGYTFAGWSPAVPATVPAGNATYTAQWKVNQYTMTFNANGGTGGKTVTQNYGTALAAPTVTREWCTFAGWSPTVPATVPANDVTYTAQWWRWGDSISASKMGGKTMRELYPDNYARMTTVILEEGITELPAGFFSGCDNVVNLTLPESLREFGIDDLPSKIRASLAYDANGFMIYGNWILDYKNRNASSVTIPEGIVGIGRGAFAEMYDLETVTMPESLRSIAEGAFEGCTYILNLQFMSGLRHVGPEAFRDCSSLLRATFADGVEYIGASAFKDCWQMKSVRLPYTVTYVGDNAFSGCGNIRGVTVPTQVKTMQNLFPAAYSKIETAEVAEGETRVMDDMFAGCVALRGGATQTDMSMIPDSVIRIGARAFQNCTSLTAFVVPDSVVEMGAYVFSGCTALWNVTLSRSLPAIPDYAFYGCSMLETMIVPESVTYLGNRFFSGRTDPTPGIVIENALYYLCTNAPAYHSSAYAAIGGNMTTYVLQDSRSWDGRQGSRVLPQTWNGYAITYWTPNRFDVTFDANGGRFDSSGGSTWSEMEITDTTYALPSTEPTRPGWAFEGWWTEQTGGAEVRYTTVVTATRTHTIYAHWRSLGNRMTVTFNSNGGTVVTPGSQDYVPGQTFGQFPVPTRRGYAFQGWWTEAVNGIRMTEATAVPAANMELFAHWTPITYYVRFHANGGTGEMADQPFVYDVRQALATHTFTRTGFAFSGWATTPSGQVRYAENASVVNLEEVQDHIVDLYAVWSGVGYSVRFDSNGGTGIMDNQTIAVGETQNLWLCAFARGGYTFAGWAVSPTDAEAKKVTYLDGQAVKDLAASNGAVVPLYAVWVIESQTVRITFDPNGGSVAPNDYWDCVIGTAVENFPTPTRPGFTFEGWFTAADGGTKVTSIPRVSDSQTFYAHWTENGSVDPGDNSCIVTFNANGGSVTETFRKVAVGSGAGTLPTPVRTGYAFTGWFTAATGGTQVTASTVVKSSVTYYAHWRYVGDADDSTIVFNTEETYETESDGSLPLDLSELVGSTSTPKISVKGLPTGLKFDAKTGAVTGKATKPGTYKVTVSATNATVKKPVTETFEISVPNLTSEKLPNLEPGRNAYGTIRCGVAFNPTWVDCTPEEGWTVKVAGLPAGLKYDAKTGKITGVPTKAGTFTVTFTASKKGEANQVATITLETAALPDWAQGTFWGYVKAFGSAPDYEDDFGFATMTVGANGKISGKLSLRGANWAFGATGFAASDGGDHFEVEAEAKAGKTTMPVKLLLQSSAAPAGGGATLLNASVEGSLGGSGVAPILLWRNVWKDKATAAAAKAEIAKWEGVYTVSAEDGGYLSLTVGKDGTVKASGKLSDGTSVSASAPLMYHVFKDFFTVLCAAPSAYKGGHVWLPVGFGTARGQLGTLGESLVVCSRNPQASGEYGAGFTRQLGFTGAFYNKTKALNDYYGALRLELGSAPVLPYSQKVTYFDWDGKKKTAAVADTAYAVDTLWQDGLTATFDTKGAPVVAKATKPVQDKETKEWSYNGTNDGAMTLSFAQTTGIFKGSYTFWYDYVSAVDETTGKETKAHTSKKVNFEGILVQGEDEMRGFYLWDAESAYNDPKTGKPKTYKYKESHPVTLSVP